MTLRARLTAAFLAVVLGPVLLGAVFVGIAVAAVSDQRATERLDAGTQNVHAALALTCQRLRLAAETTALVAAGGDQPDAAQRAVLRGLARAVEVTGADGIVLTTAGTLPPKPWADCAAPAPTAHAAIVAAVDVLDPSSRRIGRAYAVEPVDATLLSWLAESSGVRVDSLASGQPESEEGARIAAAANGLTAGETGTTSGGRLVRRLTPESGQPLTLALSVPKPDTEGLYAVLVAVVACAGVVAISVAWWLARSTTHPLTELALAVERVADGDLSARVPVRSQDEVGRLGQTFNRMTREMQGYVQALTASRDQLRGQLGVLGDTLAGTHDLDRILQVILQTATAATGAQSGVVLMVDPASGELRGQVAEGLAGFDVAELRLQLGDGLLGGVAASGEPRRGRVDRDGPSLATGEPRCITYVAVPIAAPGVGPTTGLEPQSDLPPAARGVLALYDRHGFDEFDDADLITLRTFAGQAAVAVDNVRVHEEAQRLSLTDPLTGLSNYRYLRESLRREVERASRFGRSLAALALDLDRFKEVNDTYGHAAGDAVLAEFARRLRAEIREVDFAFRQGGEEFVVLLPETDATGAAVLAERLGAAVRRSPVLVISSTPGQPPRRIPVTVSIGIAVYPIHGATGAAVLEAADDALYAAKAGGRDTYKIAPDATVRTTDAPAKTAEASATTTDGPVKAADAPVKTADGPVKAADAPVKASAEVTPGAPKAAQPPRQSRGG
ncbi:diguanylate cyclase [Dactylosporangium aurantiacum]|uniref:Diguanylate cyclase n=1 Tax=Dactylosporangium aurantiacum TaxID=35754 RepID=A0A9Q9IGQ9_9ACTN|nr:diguanylate cyclase [Dactylosporangium aurantiacum]MDG6100518.1 diguanylate cyclase [Dactylosporangium aurantiacum]UWZ55381.1 diguanylate cyclase [Dactylosporangium aurantiacum]